MKYYFTLFLILLFLGTFAQEQVNDNSYLNKLIESAHPTPDYEKYKEPVLPYILTGELNPSVFLNSNTIDSDSEENDPNRMQNESSIAVNLQNPNILISSAVDYRANSSTWIYISTDSGKSWENKNLGKPDAEWRSTNDPSVMFSTDGYGYLCYGGFGPGEVIDGINSRQNGVFLGISTDGGLNWEAHIPVIIHDTPQTPDSSFEDKYYVHVDNSDDSPFKNDLYIPWKRVIPRDSSTQIVLSKSTDRGYTWSEPVNLSDYLPGTSEDTTFGQSFPLTRTGPEGQVYTVWNHGIVHGVGFVKSEDGGATWTDPRIIHNYDIFGIATFLPGQGYRHTVKGVVRAEAYPSFEVDITDGPNRGNIYLCWAADRVPNIYFSKSTDEGETWSEPVIVHSVEENDQFWPWLAVDPTNGDIAIMYFDSRDDPENMLVQTYVSYSNDAGETWIDRRASDIGHDIRNNPFTANAFAGDYSGCAFYDGIIYPSWVDMRRTDVDFRDSDVYTAIVNTRAPNPPENFNSSFLAEVPDIVNLTWEAPTKYAFGQDLSDEDYQLRLLRDGEVIATLPGGTETYEDTDLTPFEQYEYEIYTVVENDSSVARLEIAYPGGSKEPAPAGILSYQNIPNENILSMDVQLPTVRADSVTPLSFMSRLELYRDGEYLYDIPVQNSDTGLVVNIQDVVPVRGWYTYNFIVVDSLDENNVYKSVMSNEILEFVGNPIDSYFFDGFEDEQNKYYFSGNWGYSESFSYDGNYSLTESFMSNYDRAENDTLLLFPVIPSENRVNISFYHAAITKPGDVVTFEYSFDKENWNEIAQYNNSDYEPWGDGVNDNLDWKNELNNIDAESNSLVYFRFLFTSNNLAEDDGWYIDNIEIGPTVSVENEISNDAIIVYPQPADGILWIESGNFDLTNKSFEIFDLMGTKIMSGKLNNNSIDADTFIGGVYYLKIDVLPGKQIIKKILIN